MTKNLKKIGRLAMRHEGSEWVAYYAIDGTMEGSLRLGSIRMAIVKDERRRQQFMDLMRDAVGDMLEQIMGVRPEWPHPPQPAPEHEKAGQA